MNFLLPTVFLGAVIVLVCLEVYQAAQITWIRQAFKKPKKMPKNKRNNMYNLENTKLARRTKKK